MWGLFEGGAYSEVGLIRGLTVVLLLEFWNFLITNECIFVKNWI